MKGVLLLSLGMVLGCSREQQRQVDTMSLDVIDTVKPATDTAPDAGVAAGSGGTSAPRAAATPATPAAAGGTAAKGRSADTTNIGRDRAIQPNTKDPRFRVPVIDTSRRPPR